MSTSRKSLKFRIILLSGTWIVMALIGTALVLLGFYRSHIASHYDAHVQMHMEEMVSAARLNESGELELAYPPRRQSAGAVAVSGRHGHRPEWHGGC